MVWLLSLFFGVIMFVFGAAMDWFVLGHRGPFTALTVSNAFSGALAFAVSLLFLRTERQKEQQMQHRIETLNEVNDQVRNTLQGLAFSIGRIGSAREAGELQQAIDRIRWVLNEVLPKVEPQYRTFEGSAREAGLDQVAGTPRS